MTSPKGISASELIERHEKAARSDGRNNTKATADILAAARKALEERFSDYEAVGRIMADRHSRLRSELETASRRISGLTKQLDDREQEIWPFEWEVASRERERRIKAEAELAASRRDSRRLDLISDEKHFAEHAHSWNGEFLHFYIAGCGHDTEAPTLREAIDKAMASDKASADECHKCFHKPEASAVCFCECHKRENSAGTNQGATKENR